MESGITVPKIQFGELQIVKFTAEMQLEKRKTSRGITKQKTLIGKIQIGKYKSDDTNRENTKKYRSAKTNR